MHCFNIYYTLSALITGMAWWRSLSGTASHGNRRSSTYSVPSSSSTDTHKRSVELWGFPTLSASYITQYDMVFISVMINVGWYYDILFVFAFSCPVHEMAKAFTCKPILSIIWQLHNSATIVLISKYFLTNILIPQ